MNTAPLATYSAANPAVTSQYSIITRDTADIRNPVSCEPAELNFITALRAAHVQCGANALISVINVLSDFLDFQASTSQSPFAIPFAGGFRTLQRSISELPQLIARDTAQTAGNFIGSWLIALVNERIGMNAPKIGREEIDGKEAVTFSWRREDRTLQICITGKRASYTSTNFDEDGKLEYQEGSLDLGVPAMRRTVAWLAGV